MFVNTRGVQGLVLKTLPSDRKGIYYSVVYSWPWSRSSETPVYRVVSHTKNWREVVFVDGRSRLKPALVHAKQLSSFRMGPNWKVLEERDDGLTLYGMWVSSMIFDYLIDRLDEGRYWVVAPHSPNQADEMWKRVGSISLGDVIALKVDDLNEEEVGAHFGSKKARVFLVDLIDGACIPRKVL